MNKSYNVLGDRKLLKTYRNSVMWNPEDELCKELLVLPIYDEKYKKVKIEVEIYKLT